MGGSAGTGPSGGAAGTGGPYSGCGISPKATTTLLYTTLDNDTAITKPQVGKTPGTFNTVPLNDFVSNGTCASAIQIDNSGEYVIYPAPGNISFKRGTIDFWYRPNAGHADGIKRPLVRVMGPVSQTPSLEVFKGIDSNFKVQFSNPTADASAKSTLTAIAPPYYAFSASVWTRITVTWDFSVQQYEPSVRVFFDGAEPSSYFSLALGPFEVDPPQQTDQIVIGAATSIGTVFANGAIDDFKIYDSPIAP
jgi:hypothetical protein